MPVFAAEEIEDDRLRMMFICCHPLVLAEARVALTLKTLLRIQRGGNQPRVPDDRVGDGEATDAGEAENPRTHPV